MLFNSVEFLLFFPLVFIIYWFFLGKKLKAQNWFLLLSSYFFYACWDWRFLFLLLFSTILDFFIGLKIEENNNDFKRKFWFWLSIVANLGFLGFFKYYNFFVESFATMLLKLGFQPNISTLKIILPVGISFYTFHGLSYVIDIYKKRIKPERNFVDYGVFVSFFPLLVAGPIERATHLLPQIKKIRIFNYKNCVDGLRQILWGLFKKVVVADSCAKYANLIFNDSSDYSGSTLIIGAILFSFQIYGDFSGYSDIALGTARLLGIDLLKNFSYPYFSRDIAEFWRRWHISLSSWFRDYVYIPLGGSRVSKIKQVRNVFIIFLLSGFWHGANWTFIAWGFLHALYFIPLMLFNKNKQNVETIASNNNLPSFKEILNICITFILVAFAWIFFRANDLQHAFSIVTEIFSRSTFSIPEYLPKKVFIFLFILIAIEWISRNSDHALASFGLNWPKPLRLFFYYSIIFLIFYCAGEGQEFIYFQF